MRTNNLCQHLWNSVGAVAGDASIVSIDLPTELLQRIRSLADGEGLSVPAVIELAVVSFLEAPLE